MYRQLVSLIFVATFFTSNFAVKANEPYLFGFGGFSWVEDSQSVPTYRVLDCTPAISNP